VKKYLLILIIFISNVNASERWVLIGSNRESTTYVNVNSIQRNGEFTTGWFKTISPNYYVKSSLSKMNFNCRAEKYNVPESYLFEDLILSKPASTLPVISVSKFSFPDYGTVERLQFDYACK